MDTSGTAPASGLQTIVDVIVAPRAAFERLRTQPTWGWAFAITLVAYGVSVYLIEPALQHGFQASWPQMLAANPRLAALPAGTQQQYLQFGLSLMRYYWIIAVVLAPLAMLVAAVIMLIFSAIGRGSATFKSLWAASANVAVVSLALASVVVAVIVLLRGAASFDSTTAVETASPSLAWIVPSANVKLAAFLGAISVFQIWSAGLTYAAIRFTARAGAVPAAFGAVVILLFPALLAAAGAR